MLWIILLCQLILPIFAAHKNKFRDCSSTGFCSRQKELHTITYYLDSNSAKIKNNEFQSILLYASNPTDETKKLRFSVSRVINNVLRIFVTELNPIRKRYQINDVMTSDARTFIPFTDVKQNTNECTLSWNDKYSVTITYKPFKILITNNGINEILINEFNKFYFEPYIHRKIYDNTDCDDDNEDESKHCEHEPDNEKALWEERFSSHTYYYDNGPSSIGLDFTFINTNNIYGIPEHASSFKLKDTLDDDDNSYAEPYRLWNLDVFEYELDCPDALYGAIPYIIGHNKHNTNGVLWMNSAETYIDVRNSKQYNNAKNIRWMSESGVLETFIILSDNIDNNGYLYQYYKLTGFPQLPPIFSLGHHQCRWNYNDIDDVFSISDKFDELNIPNDFIWLDIEHTDGKRYFTWDKHNFKQPNKMLQYIESSGRKMVTIVDPHIKEDNNYYIHQEIDKFDLWTKNRDNNVYSGWCWPGTSKYPDFTNPKMRQLWAEQFNYNKYEYSTSSLFIWNDMNEPSVFDGPEVSMPISNIHYNNVRHNEIHNLYGYYVHQSTYNGLLLRDKNKLRPFVLSRSFFSGSQQYGAIWTGDNTANWQHLKISIPMLLSLSVAGLPFVGADIGGFFNNPDGELMARWYELGAYYPFFRNHAHQHTKRRELWEFDDQYAIRMKHAILARYRILPYVYTLFYLSFSQSHPIMQPLWYVFNSDETVFDREDAFMFGDAFYIHPIVESGIDEIDIDLPQNNNGNAIFYETGNKVNIYRGGNRYHLSGYLSSIPVLRYGGSITVEKHRIRRSSSTMIYDPVSVVIAVDVNGNANGYNYIDDEHSLNHINQDEYIFSEIECIRENNKNKIINRIIHDNNSKNIQLIEIERIVIMSDNIHKKQLSEIHIKQLTNSRKTGQYGVGYNTLVIRKPQIFINLPFEIVFS